MDIESIRSDFPALHQNVNGHPLIWLDNAATTQKPQSVIDAVASFYSHDYSNIHRGAHTLAARATELYEAGREKVQRFIGANGQNPVRSSLFAGPPRPSISSRKPTAASSSGPATRSC